MNDRGRMGRRADGEKAADILVVAKSRRRHHR